MILSITEKEAELIYRLLGGKTQADTSSIGNQIGAGIDNSVVSLIGEADLETSNSLMAKVVEKRQNSDKRILAKLDKIVQELQDSGFSEEEVAKIQTIKSSADTHNKKKYSAVKQKKAN